jgi:hypothetical protein
MAQQLFVANTLTARTIICCITTVQEVTSINGKHPNDCKVSEEVVKKWLFHST